MRLVEAKVRVAQAPDVDLVSGTKHIVWRPFHEPVDVIIVTLLISDIH